MNDLVLIVAFERLYGISIISWSMDDFVQAVKLPVDFMILTQAS